jgi:hypothetical protein
VAAALVDWRRRTNGGTVQIRPWLQDFDSGGIDYDAEEVKAQIAAAESVGATGYLLWNADCVYSPGVFPTPDDIPDAG